MSDVVADPEQLALAAIWEEHRPTMLERVDVLDRAAAALVDDALDAELEAAAGHAAHQLAGAVGTFGFWGATERAREAEEILHATALTSAEAPRLRELATSLREALTVDPLQAGTSLPSPAREGSPMVLIVDDDSAVTERLAAEAERRGMRPEVAVTPAEARVIEDRRRPDAVILDLAFDGEGTKDAMALLSDLAGRKPAVPVLVFSVRDGFEDRLEVARRGAAGFLDKTMSPSDALDQVSQALDRRITAGTRVLAVDDDPAVLATARALLEARGLEVTTVGDPRHLWDELKRVDPALLLLDVDMPGASGIELCRVLRNDRRWAAVPIVVLTARRDADTIQEVFAAGADDFLVKPVVGSELVTRIENRLDRFLLHQALADTDALTGLANRRTSQAALGQLIRLASRFDKTLCLAELDLDHFKRINDRHGHAAGDAVLRRLGDLLRRSFRGEDIVARWGGEEFIIGMYGLTRAEAVERVDDLLASFRKEEFLTDDERFSVTFSAGVAQYPLDGEDLDGLYRTADESLYQAKSLGRNRVVGDPGAPVVETVDVAIVEDDDGTAALLVAALEAEGHRWRRYSNGMQAVDSLCGEVPAARAGLMLLDIDIPALNGFEVLASMAQDGVLETTPVLMLTGTSDGADVQRARDLGAVEYITKPFSVPVLMQKVRRALER